LTAVARPDSALGETGTGEPPLDLSSATDRRILRYLVDQATRDKYPYVNESAWAERINGYTSR
jgi:hypothetical protein